MAIDRSRGKEAGIADMMARVKTLAQGTRPMELVDRAQSALRALPAGKQLFGRGALSQFIPKSQQVVSRLGAFDDHLYEAKKIVADFERAGVRPPPGLIGPNNEVDLDLLRKLTPSMPGLGIGERITRAVTGGPKVDKLKATATEAEARLAQFSKAGPRDASEAATRTHAAQLRQLEAEAAQARQLHEINASGVSMSPQALSQMQAIRAAGHDISPQEFQQLARVRGDIRSGGREAKDMVIGEAPLEVTRQRYIQGGLIGPGGVLLGDMAPNVALQRVAKRTWDAAKAGDLATFEKELKPTLGRGLGYALGAGFTYGMIPGSAKDTYDMAQESGESPGRAVAANLAGSVLNVVSSPLGMGQMLLYDPAMKLVNRGFGTKSYDEMSQAVANRAVAQQATTRASAATSAFPGRARAAAPPATGAPMAPQGAAPTPPMPLLRAPGGAAPAYPATPAPAVPRPSLPTPPVLAPQRPPTLSGPRPVIVPPRQPM